MFVYDYSIGNYLLIPYSCLLQIEIKDMFPVGLLVIASRRKNFEKTVLLKDGKLLHLTAICRHFCGRFCCNEPAIENVQKKCAECFSALKTVSALQQALTADEESANWLLPLPPKLKYGIFNVDQVHCQINIIVHVIFPSLKCVKPLTKY